MGMPCRKVAPVRSIFTIVLFIFCIIIIYFCKDNTLFLISKFIFDALSGNAPLPHGSKPCVPLLYDKAVYSVRKLNPHWRGENPIFYR